jgi:iron complex transport system substrate-binding protein
MHHFPPRRVVCLTEETVETLYLLGEQDRIVGVSGYAVRPPRVRREKPRVSAFISADIPKILALDPDLVLAFSICRPTSSPTSSDQASPCMSSTSATSQASLR